MPIAMNMSPIEPQNPTSGRLGSDRSNAMFSQPACETRYTARMIITTYTAGPAQSMKRRMTSMPFQNRATWATHRIP